MNKYYRFPTVRVRGFIVNHTDNLNYDVCFDFESMSDISSVDDISKRYNNISTSSSSVTLKEPISNLGYSISNRYHMVHREPCTYTDINIKDSKLIEPIRYNDSIGIISSGSIKNGTSYRCRLKTIDAIKPFNSILDEVNSLVYYNDGWVMCEISDVDIYNRLLIEIYDIDMTYSINKILLKNYPQIFKYYPVNNKYSPREGYIRGRSFNFSDSKRNLVKSGRDYKHHNSSRDLSWK